MGGRKISNYKVKNDYEEKLLDNEIEESWEQLKNTIIKTADEMINTKVAKQIEKDWYD